MKTQNRLQRGLSTLGLVAFLAFFSANVAHAQQGSGSFVGSDNDRSARFGVKGGLNISNLYASPENVDTEDKWRYNFHVGLFWKIPLGGLFALQPEALYSSAGSKIAYGNNPFNIRRDSEVRFNLNYLQVPVMVSLTLGPVSLQAGPYVSYLLAANVKDLESDNVTNPNTLVEFDNDDFNKIDYGLAGGVMFDVKGFQLGARYNYGLREIGNSSLASQVVNNAKNHVIQVSAAVGF